MSSLHRFFPNRCRDALAFLVAVTLIPSGAASAAELHLNQLGFLPEGKKTVVITAGNPLQKAELIVKRRDNNQLVTRIELQAAKEKTLAGEHAWIADFSEVKTSGDYLLEIPVLDITRVVTVAPSIYDALADASIKAFYFQRASTALDKTHADLWERPAAHPDDRVLIHPSAASPKRPAGTMVSAPKGWYDAGDYNKYVVNSGITMGTLMSAYERYPDFFRNRVLNIPESDNPVPDILDEVHYNLEWLLAMQDPEDGGVYHKLTTAGFEGMVAAHEAVQPRYMVQKTTAAALDFAAVMAQAARVFEPYFPSETPGYLQAAQQAWQWAEKNPDVAYRQEQLNKTFDPDVTTGAYGDEQFGDERLWAAAELYIATGEKTFWSVLESASTEYQLPNWGNVRWLGYYSLLAHKQRLPESSGSWRSAIEKSLVSAATQLQQAGSNSAYRVPMVSEPRNFVWGSNAVAANQGILLLEAFRITGNTDFLRSAEDTRDYLLGRNATGYSFVTGFGDKTPQHPHHRLAAARPDLPPLPGFLVGGPNPSQPDGCTYPSKVADLSYTDHVCSYASNEIAINWNAPLAYLINGLNAIESQHSEGCPHHE
ncbi:glycoside hydrolase family 9 protein [Microbulbifer bruguierae]|uniref:Endoglucanase n=1 Tax=Microbulbifer bruguierae TaxID=3029061 RepID=A0ABY8NIT6_9GAMM|nr:glycoside hydrolase family 9 protein [Microbulbifer bruguierae]WGL18365.1 glycoside hydrolase family 9 protein [Microbulbifer bruguierae]